MRQQLIKPHLRPTSVQLNRCSNQINSAFESDSVSKDLIFKCIRERNKNLEKSNEDLETNKAILLPKPNIGEEEKHETINKTLPSIMYKKSSQFGIQNQKSIIPQLLIEYEKCSYLRNPEVMEQLFQIVQTLPFIQKVFNKNGEALIKSALNEMSLEILDKGIEIYSQYQGIKNNFYILLNGQALMTVENKRRLVLQERKEQKFEQQQVKNKSRENILNIEIIQKPSLPLKKRDLFTDKQRSKIISYKKQDKENFQLDCISNQQIGDIEHRVISGPAIIGEKMNGQRDVNFEVLQIEIKSVKAFALKLDGERFIEIFAEFVRNEEIERKKEILKQISILRGLSPCQFEDILDKIEIKSLTKGQFVYKENSKVDYCYIVKKGEFVIEKEIDSQIQQTPDFFKRKIIKKSLICSLTEGQMFGNEELLEDICPMNSSQIRQNSVKCMSQEGEVFSIPFQQLAHYLQNQDISIEKEIRKSQSEFRSDIIVKQRQSLELQEQNLLVMRKTMKSQQRQQQLDSIISTQKPNNSQSKQQIQEEPMNIGYIISRQRKRGESSFYLNKKKDNTFLTRVPDQEDQNNKNFCTIQIEGYEKRNRSVTDTNYLLKKSNQIFIQKPFQFRDETVQPKQNQNKQNENNSKLYQTLSCTDSDYLHTTIGNTKTISTLSNMGQSLIPSTNYNTLLTEKSQNCLQSKYGNLQLFSLKRHIKTDSMINLTESQEINNQTLKPLHVLPSSAVKNAKRLIKKSRRYQLKDRSQSFFTRNQSGLDIQELDKPVCGQTVQVISYLNQFDQLPFIDRMHNYSQ